MNSTLTTFNRSAVLLLVVAVTLVTIGCGQQSSEPSSGSTPVAKTNHDDHNHGGWWCVEHGIPEEECSMCSADAADEFKEKGDWCEEHNRAESQCFKCDPSRAEKYAKLYEAKFGHAPPAPTE